MTDSHREFDTTGSQLSPLEATDEAAAPASLSLLHDLTMPVAIELGRTRMSVQDILALGRGSVIQLERLAGEPIDVFVGDRRFAEGEVVVVGEQFGVRVTRVLHAGRSDGEAVA
jgi:flagellar motor switch protein FliN/FliY